MPEYETSPIYDGGETGTNQDATGPGGVHRRGAARHRWSPSRSIHGATTQPFADRAEPAPAPPPPPREIHPPNGRGVNPS